MSRSGGGVRALSLIEMLCVIAIISVLAALVLPAINQGRARAKRIDCVNHLRQTGLAFHAFAHDHNGRFPMSVPLSAGGSQEFAQSAPRIGNEYFFSYRHFQALSGDLTTTKLLVCPADTRTAATNFGALKNENLSYFVALTADYQRPDLILSGDRNLASNRKEQSPLERLDANGSLRWTHELHQFKGNLLFADGRVEAKNNPGVVLPPGPSASPTELAFPTLPKLDFIHFDGPSRAVRL